MEETSSATTQMDKNVDAPRSVGELAEACSKAPKYGRNGRALVLEMARKLAEEDDFVFPSAPGGTPNQPTTSGVEKKPLHAKQKPASQKMRDCKALFDAIPFGERPMIEYNPRMTKVPRLIRQDSVAALIGKILGLVLEVLGIDQDKAIEVVGEDYELRKTAMAVALVQEQRLYVQSASKISYTAAVAKFEADKSHLPAECVMGLQAKYTGRKEATTGKKRKSVELSPEVEVEGSSTSSSSSSESEDEEKIANCKMELEETLLEDTGSMAPTSSMDVPWDHCEKWLSEAEKQLEEQDEYDAPWNQYKRGEHRKLAHKSSGPAVSGSGQKKDTTKQSVCMEVGSCKNTAATWSNEGGVSNSKEKSASRAEIQLNDFVRGELDPLLRVGVLTPEVHAAALKKTVDKVMLCHSDDENADFLITEGLKIRKLIQQYIRYFRSRGL